MRRALVFLSLLLAVPAAAETTIGLRAQLYRHGDGTFASENVIGQKLTCVSLPQEDTGAPPANSMLVLVDLAGDFDALPKGRLQVAVKAGKRTLAKQSIKLAPFQSGMPEKEGKTIAFTVPVLVYDVAMAGDVTITATLGSGKQAVKATGTVSLTCAE